MSGARMTLSSGTEDIEYRDYRLMVRQYGWLSLWSEQSDAHYRERMKLRVAAGAGGSLVMGSTCL